MFAVWVQPPCADGGQQAGDAPAHLPGGCCRMQGLASAAFPKLHPLSLACWLGSWGHRGVQAVPVWKQGSIPSIRAHPQFLVLEKAMSGSEPQLRRLGQVGGMEPPYQMWPSPSPSLLAWVLVGNWAWSTWQGMANFPCPPAPSSQCNKKMCTALSWSCQESRADCGGKETPCHMGLVHSPTIRPEPASWGKAYNSGALYFPTSIPPFLPHPLPGYTGRRWSLGLGLGWSSPGADEHQLSLAGHPARDPGRPAQCDLPWLTMGSGTDIW